MRGFPFVLGTDIVQISRFDPASNLIRIQKLAQRFLHPAEISYLETRYPHYHALLRATNPKSLSPGRNVSEGKYFSDATRSEHPLSHSNPLLQGNAETQKLKSWLAGRWAAKEAARKAWGADIIGYKDVRIEVGKALSSSSSASVSILCEPYVNPTKQAIDGLSQDNESFTQITSAVQPMQEGALSISHDGDYVVATVIAESLKEELRSYFRSRSEEARKAITGLP